MKAANPKKTPRLVSHRTVAHWLDVAPSTLRAWVMTGEFPEPLSVICQTWFYPAGQVEHWVKTGRWPEGTRFKRVPRSPARAGA